MCFKFEHDNSVHFSILKCDPPNARTQGARTIYGDCQDLYRDEANDNSMKSSIREVKGDFFQ